MRLGLLLLLELLKSEQLLLQAFFLLPQMLVLHFEELAPALK